MRGPSTPMDDCVRALGDRLHGPARLRADLLAEARDSLTDAVEAYVNDGLDERVAQRRAVAEFGDPAELASAYQTELSTAALRGLAVRVGAVAVVAVTAGDLTWQGSSWSDGPRPPAGYVLLAASLDWLWLGCALLAAVCCLWVTWSARQGWPRDWVLTRALGFGLAGALGVGSAAGAVLYVWSVGLWDASVTWPPMIIGGIAFAAACLWLGRGIRSFLAAAYRPTFAVGDLRLEPAGVPQRQGIG